MLVNFDCFNLHCHHEAIWDTAGDYTQADAHLALPLLLVFRNPLLIHPGGGRKTHYVYVCVCACVCVFAFVCRILMYESIHILILMCVRYNRYNSRRLESLLWDLNIYFSGVFSFATRDNLGALVLDMLFHWARAQKNEAPGAVSRLVAAMIESGRRDLAEEIEDIVNIGKRKYTESLRRVGLEAESSPLGEKQQ